MATDIKPDPPQGTSDSGGVDFEKRISTLAFDPSKIVKSFILKSEVDDSIFNVPNRATIDLEDVEEADEDTRYECVICHFVFSSLGNLKVHMKTHNLKSEDGNSDDDSSSNEEMLYRRKIYACSFCKRTFFTSSTLKNHERVHLGKTPYECSQCGRSFTHDRNLYRHMKSVHNVADADIKAECSKPLKIKSSDATDNLVYHSGGEVKQFTCSICSKTFKRLYRAKAHARTHSGTKPYQCSVCTKVFALSEALYKHVKKMHRGGFGGKKSGKSCRKMKSQPQAQQEVVTVDHGAVSIPEQPPLNIQIQHGGNQINFINMPKPAAPDAFMHRVGQSSYNPMASYETSLPTHYGATCHLQPLQSVQSMHHMQPVHHQMSAMTQVSPQVHHQVHQIHQVQPLHQVHEIHHQQQVQPSHQPTMHVVAATPMQQLGQDLSQETAPEQAPVLAPPLLTPQANQAAKDMAFQCSICGVMFGSAAELNRHIPSHKLKVPIKCTTCGKEFKDKSDLNRHMTTHTGEKPYKCTMCPKAYARPYRLNNHMRTHTGEKPYQCTVCGKCFGVTEGLYKHINKMHQGQGKEAAAHLIRQIKERNWEIKHGIVDSIVNDM